MLIIARPQVSRQ